MGRVFAKLAPQPHLDLGGDGRKKGDRFRRSFSLPRARQWLLRQQVLCPRAKVDEQWLFDANRDFENE